MPQQITDQRPSRVDRDGRNGWSRRAEAGWERVFGVPVQTDDRLGGDEILCVSAVDGCYCVGRCHAVAAPR